MYYIVICNFHCIVGNVTRVCNSNGSWAEPDASQCMGVAFVQAFEQVRIEFNSLGFNCS